MDASNRERQAEWSGGPETDPGPAKGQQGNLQKGGFPFSSILPPPLSHLSPCGVMLEIKANLPSVSVLSDAQGKLASRCSRAS